MKECSQCGDEYEIIGQHWSLSPDCSHPPLSRHQREVAAGLLMGDGCINNGSKNPSLQAEMIRPNYLRHVDGVFGVLGCGVKMKETGKEAAQRMEDSGLYEASYEADPNNFHDVYVWRSVRHPTYREFRKWYSSGGKVWPDDIELTQ